LIDLVVESDEKLRLIFSTMREHYKNTNMRFEPCRIYTNYKFAYFPTDMFIAGKAKNQ